MVLSWEDFWFLLRRGKGTEGGRGRWLTVSLMAAAPIVLRRWMSSWITKTMTRRDGIVVVLLMMRGDGASHEGTERP